MILYLDTAASRFHTDSKTHEEPRMLRIAWWRDDAEHPVCRLIQPCDGMTIDPATTKYHGLTVDVLRRDGVPAARVIAELEHAAQEARTIVSFHQRFHWSNIHRLMGASGSPLPTTAVCAMALAEPVLSLPRSRGTGTRSPSLAECCEHFKVAPPVAGDPVQIGLSTVAAVRHVFEACTKEHQR